MAMSNQLRGAAALVYADVTAAMQNAEELGGPDHGDYVALMLAIAAEANERVRSYRAAHPEVTTPAPALPEGFEALALALRDIGKYTGDGPNTTPWREIVRGLSEKARGALAAAGL